MRRYKEFFLVDVTNDDYDIPDKLENCRAIWSDTGGSVRVQIKDYYENVTADHILTLNAGSWTQVGNITKVYRYLTGTTACESQVYDLTYTAVNGIKLGF